MLYSENLMNDRTSMPQRSIVTRKLQRAAIFAMIVRCTID